MRFRALAIVLVCGTSRAEDVADPGHIAQFSVSPSLKHQTTEIAVGVIPGDHSPFEYWFRKITTHRDRGTAEAAQWTDTLSCPAARGVLEGLTELQMPRPQLVGLKRKPATPADPEKIIVHADGTGYELRVATIYPANSLDTDLDYDGAISLTSRDGTPLANWAEGALKILGPCWTNHPPPR